MSARIHIDQPNAKCFTNLDFVTGRVFIVFPTDATISAVTVKLEAESRTRLAGPKFPGNERSDKKRTELEVHKYTLLAGQYEYPFRFKFPFNNDCSKTPSALRDLKVGQLSVQFAPDTCRHVKKALPPSLSGFPGEAEIKYYIKATVIRPKFYQENLRQQVDIKFLPIEPPRPPDTHEETFARRKQQFQKFQEQPQKKSLFKKKAPLDQEEEPVALQVDARLPNPAIITCNEPLPLRILVQRLNESSASVFLSMLQIELIAYTNVRAHDLNRTESGSWVLMSQANMNIPLDNPTDKSRNEWKLPSRLWDNIPLPNTVAPSFDTCNLSRKYELEVRVGLSHGMSSGVRPELIVVPLRLPVLVYSGIAPPPQLLRAMAAHNQTHATNPPFPAKRPTVGHYESFTSDSPTTPIQDHTSVPPQVGSYGPSPYAEDPDEAPPSYEDAIAEDIAPVDGPRRSYSVPADPEQSPQAFKSDSKRGGIGRRASERLFPQNAPSSPSRILFRRSQTEATVAEQSEMSNSGLDTESTLDDDLLAPPLPARPATYDTKKGKLQP